MNIKMVKLPNVDFPKAIHSIDDVLEAAIIGQSLVLDEDASERARCFLQRQLAKERDLPGFSRYDLNHHTYHHSFFPHFEHLVHAAALFSRTIGDTPIVAGTVGKEMVVRIGRYCPGERKGYRAIAHGWELKPVEVRSQDVYLLKTLEIGIAGGSQDMYRMRRNGEIDEATFQS